MGKKIDDATTLVADSDFMKRISHSDHVPIWMSSRWGLSIGMTIVLGGVIVVAVFKPYIARQGADVTTTLLQDEELLSEVSLRVQALLQYLTTSSKTQQDLVGLLTILFEDPTTLESLTGLVVRLLNHPDTRVALADLLRDPEVHAGCASLVRGSLWRTATGATGSRKPDVVEPSPSPKKDVDPAAAATAVAVEPEPEPSGKEETTSSPSK